MTYQERRKFITGLVRTGRISTQTELLDQLVEHGYDVTQATVSRDIAAIGLVKVGGVYSTPDRQHSPKAIHESIRNRVLEVREAGPNLVVIRTSPGEAGALGVAIDRTEWPSISGTIAGDDTVFVACASRAGQKDFINRLMETAPGAYYQDHPEKRR